MAKFEKLPEQVEAWRTRGDRTVSTPNGPVKAQPGQWIVPAGDGVYVVLNDEVFRAQYEPKDNAAKAMLKAELKTADQEAEEAKANAAQELESDAAEEAKVDAKEKAKAEKKSKKNGKKEEAVEMEPDKKGNEGGDGDKDK